MKKSAILFIVLSIIFGSIMSSCNTSPGVKRVNLDREFTLAIGESAGIEDQNMEITFLQVLEDSRCPRNVTCIWAGRVSAAVEITGSQPGYKMVLTQPGLSGQPATETYKEYEFAFNVTPYPESGKQIASEEYRLNLTVSKK